MNILKPKKTTLNPRALVYRRVTRIIESKITSMVYSCAKIDGTYAYYMYDKDTDAMVLVNVNTLDINPSIISIPNDLIVLTSGTNYFYWNKNYNFGVGRWETSSTMPINYSTLLDAGFTPIGKINTNAYYYVGAIDFVITGEVAGTKTQPIKGNIMPLTSMNIKYFDDFIDLEEDDMVVVNGALYSVESPDYSIKHQPRPYKVYYATLNSVL